MSRPRILWCLLLVACMVNAARGQSGGGALQEAVRADFLPRDEQALTVILQLTPEQRTKVAGLLEAYTSSFQSGVKLLRQAVADAALKPPSPDPRRQAAERELQEQRRQITTELKQRMADAGDDADLVSLRTELRERVEAARRELGLHQPDERLVEARVASEAATREVLEQWMTTRDDMRDRLIVSIRGLLADEQIARWPAAERHVVRERLISRGRLSGEGTNLLDIVRAGAVPPDAREQVETVLEEYAGALHRVLTLRTRTLRRTTLDMAAALAAEDIDAATAALRAEAESRMAVREVNERYAAVLAEALGDPEGPALVERFRRAAYSSVYADTPVDRAFRRLRAEGGLDEETAAAVEGLQAAYEDERGRINDWLIVVLRREEPARARRRLLGSRDQAAGPDPIVQALAEKQVLSQRYLRQLESLVGARRVGTRSGLGAGGRN